MIITTQEEPAEVDEEVEASADLYRKYEYEKETNHIIIQFCNQRDCEEFREHSWDGHSFIQKWFCDEHKEN